jgi:hypothetical protein
MSRRKQRMQDLREAKDKRMKKVAVGLSVVLAIVLAFEVPKVLNSGGSSSSTPPAATTTDTASTGTPAPTTTPPGTAAAAVTPVASTKLPNSDVQPRRGKAQLYSFSHFAGKDPFVQQVVSAPAGVAAQTPSGTSATGSATAPKASHPSSSSSNSSARTLAVTGSASISVNGRVQVVRVGASFPSSNPLFRLVGVSRGLVRVGIANGSYSSGAKTVSLSPGRTLTLVDTADGIRYRIRLVSVG